MSVPVAVSRVPDGGLLEVEVRYQGCAEDGICYPPMKRQLGFTLTGGANAAASPPPQTTTANDLSAADRITRDLAEASLATTLATFFGLGLLLSLTPCVFPMVPILSGIIVGQQQPVSTARALGLSSVYVIAMAATYAVAGIVAGLAGHNLQAAFQHPAVIVSFAAVFVALALSMFGFYELSLPASLQSKLDGLSRRQASGSVPGVAVMGALSAIIVGPCVAPPLAGALAYIGQTGSPTVGGLALFVLGLGMGVPLLLVGTSAGALLPRAGSWMDRIKQVFGVVFLGVAVWFLERVLPAPLTLMLWAALAVGSAVFLGATSRLEHGAGNASRLGQALGVLLLVWGVLLTVGAASGARDPLAPLAALGAGGAAEPASPEFIAVKSTADVDRQLAAASSAGEAVEEPGPFRASPPIQRHDPEPDPEPIPIVEPAATALQAEPLPTPVAEPAGEGPARRIAVLAAALIIGGGLGLGAVALLSRTAGNDTVAEPAASATEGADDATADPDPISPVATDAPPGPPDQLELASLRFAPSPTGTPALAPSPGLDLLSAAIEADPTQPISVNVRAFTETTAAADLDLSVRQAQALTRRAGPDGGRSRTRWRSPGSGDPCSARPSRCPTSWSPAPASIRLLDRSGGHVTSAPSPSASTGHLGPAPPGGRGGPGGPSPGHGDRAGPSS